MSDRCFYGRAGKILALSALLLVSSASISNGAALYWNEDRAYPLVYSQSGTVWYLDTASAKVSSNNADGLIFSVNILLVDPAKDPNAYEFSRYWFRKPQSTDRYAVYVRHGDIGEWTPLRLNDPASPQNLQNLFLTGWEAATGFTYDPALPPLIPEG